MTEVKPLETVADAAPEVSVAPEKKTFKPGRNLPAAVGVALGLLTVLGLSLAFRPEPFVILVAIIIGGGMWELRSALEKVNLEIAIWPLLLGTAGMVVSAYLFGASGLLTAFVLTLLATVIWHLALGAMERAPVSRLSLIGSIFAAGYLPFMASFLVLLLRQNRGNWLVVLLILLSVANDTGGYFAGVLFGKHPMAPSVSPKKSWEGFIGSVLLTSLVGILGTHWVLGLPFTPNLSVAQPGGPSAAWLTIFGSALGIGILLGIVAAITSTLGDLSESLIKRDLGVKDMGSILPGHGGILDRIDSILFSAPFIFLVLVLANQHSYPVAY
jgi:phosphatidate cytidylyltransferase